MDTNTMSSGMQDFLKEESLRLRPKHYGDAGSDHDCIAYCMANGIGFLEGNIIKYVTRWRQKGGVEDLKKAAEYLRRLIEREEEHEE